MNKQVGLTKEECLRYSRHLTLPEVGAAGQERLKSSRVLVVGAGGLGSPVILYLAAAGVGTLGIVDYDAVDLSNLQRQVIYSTGEIGLPKAEQAKRRALDLNPSINVIAHNTRIDASNVLKLLAGYDLVVDGTDNFATRYLINDACVLSGKPNVYGSIYRFEGQASVFAYGGPCYRCLYPQPPEAGVIPDCAEGGVLGVMAGVVGSIQAGEAIKILLSKGSTLSGKLLLFDALAASFDILNLSRDKNCPVCGDNPTICTVEDTAAACSAYQSPQEPVALCELSARELEKELSSGKELFILDVRTVEEHRSGHLANARLIPLQELPDRLAELDRHLDIVVYCKGGARSKKAIEILRAAGFARLRNLTGGILSWASEVEPSLNVY